MRGVSRGLLVVMMSLAGLVRFAAAQDQKQEAKQEQMDAKNTTRVTLGGTSGTPGTSVVVPIYFTPAEGKEVGSLKLGVNFISRNVKYSRLDAGIAAEMGGVDLHPEIKEGKNEQGLETTAVTIVASFPGPTPPPKGIPAGLLGYLTFQISESAKPASIALRATVEATELGANKPVQNLRAFDAQLDVIAPGSEPMVVCFFFTH